MDETRSTVNWTGAEAVPVPSYWDQPLSTWPPAYAGFWRRFFARCVDGLVLLIPSKILDSVMEGAIPDDESEWATGLIVVAVWLVAITAMWWLYEALQLSSVHQATLGRRALGIVVTDLNGDRISFARATGRYFADYVSLITFGIGYLIQLFTPKRQALHDLIAGTVVVLK
jgi:uncharacterized RDD family membrane protein YckC